MKAVTLGGALAMLTTTGAMAQEEPLNVAEWTAAAEIITDAKGILEQSGWAQAEAIDSGKECLSTALEAAWQKAGASLVEFDYVRAAIDSAIDTPVAEKLTADADPLSVPYWGRYYMYWNDAQGRTEEEVLGALDKALSFAENEISRAKEINATGDDVAEFDREMMKTLGLEPSN